MKRILSSTEPYKGVIYFIVILLVSHFTWKYTVLGDDSDKAVTFLNYDISSPFNALSDNVAKVCATTLNFFGSDVALLPHNVLRYENGVSVRIIWACSGLKQAYIFFCIIAFYRGPWKKKLWYVPLGLLIVYLFNIFRITAIVALIEHHPTWFDFLHEELFKYLFYAVIFGMWVYWEERIAIPYFREKKMIVEN